MARRSDTTSALRIEEKSFVITSAGCVEHAIASGSKADQRRKIEELNRRAMAVVSRADP